jgi:hypothetical protein
MFISSEIYALGIVIKQVDKILCEIIESVNNLCFAGNHSFLDVFFKR